MARGCTVRPRRTPVRWVIVCVLLLAAVDPGARGAGDVAALAAFLNEQLAPSNLGYESRILSIAETGRDGLAVSFWAQRFSAGVTMGTGVLTDAWHIFRAAFPAAGYPREIAVTAFFPVRNEEGGLTTRVVGHFRLTRETFQRIDPAGFSPEGLPEVAELAFVHVEGIDF